MAAFTAEQAQLQLDAYLTAERAVLSGQAYEIAGRRMTRANLREVREGIEYWRQQVATLTMRATGRGRARTIIPAD